MSTLVNQSSKADQIRRQVEKLSSHVRSDIKELFDKQGKQKIKFIESFVPTFSEWEITGIQWNNKENELEYLQENEFGQKEGAQYVVHMALEDLLYILDALEAYNEKKAPKVSSAMPKKVIELKPILLNESTRMVLNLEKKEISGACLKDTNNEPRCYNKTSRSIKRAWEALQTSWTETMSMYEAARILGANGLDMRSYCAMD